MERPRHDKLARKTFRDLIRIVILELFLKKEKPTAVKIKDSLRDMDVSLSSGKPEDIKEILITEKSEKLRRKIEAIAAEKQRKREEIAADLRRRQAKHRPKDSLVGSPMANLGDRGGAAKKIPRFPDSDGEYKND